MLENYPDVLTVEELIEILRVGKNTTYRLLNEGKIKNLKVSNKFIIPKKCVIEFLESAN